MGCLKAKATLPKCTGLVPSSWTRLSILSRQLPEYPLEKLVCPQTGPFGASIRSIDEPEACG